MHGGKYLRTQNKIRADGYDHLTLTYLVDGMIGLAGTHADRLRPKEVIVGDLSSPSAFVITDAEVIQLIVPRILFPAAAIPDTPRPIQHLRQKDAWCLLIGKLLEALFDGLPVFSRQDVLILRTCIPDFLAWGLNPTDSDSPITKGALVCRLRRYIEENLRKKITPALLAKEFGVSRSQLYRLFHSTGGINAYIQKRRLLRSRRALCDPQLAHLRIQDIADDAGFPDAAHFSRLFKHRFGISPQSARASSRMDMPPATNLSSQEMQDSARFARWLETLGTD